MRSSARGFVATLLVAFAAPLVGAQPLPDLRLAGHAQPLALLEVDGALGARLVWSIGGDGLVVAWARESWAPVAWRPIDGARAIGGLYAGAVAVETSDGVLRLDPETLADVDAQAFEPGARLASPAGLPPDLVPQVALPAARRPTFFARTRDGVVLAEASAWCHVSPSPTPARCVETPTAVVVGATSDHVLTCTEVAGSVVAEAWAVSDASLVASVRVAGRCPEVAVSDRERAVLATGRAIVELVGGTLSTADAAGALLATRARGPMNDRLVLAERFDPDCATTVRRLERWTTAGGRALGGTSCDAFDSAIPVRDDHGAVVGLALIESTDAVRITGWDLAGRPLGTLERDLVPGARAWVGSATPLTFVDPGLPTEAAVPLGDGLSVTWREGEARIGAPDVAEVGVLLTTAGAVVRCSDSAWVSDGLATRAFVADIDGAARPLTGDDGGRLSACVRRVFNAPQPR